MEKFVTFLGTIPNRMLRKNLIIVGDLNACPQRDEKSREFRTLNGFLTGKNFTQLILHPTYYSHNSNPSILDKIEDKIKILDKFATFQY